MDKGNVKVLKGEASESDEDEQEQTTTAASITKTSNQNMESQAKSQQKLVKNTDDGVVISGEASESDSDEGEKVVPENDPAIQINTKLTTESISEVTTPTGPHYDTLLQAKLREKNIALRSHLQAAVKDTYISSAKDIDIITQHLCRSQVTIQDASQCMRLVTSDLIPLQEKLDIVVTCNILPDIQI